MLSDSLTVNTGISYYFNVDKRNFMLMFIPSMFEISRGKRKYEGVANYTSTIYKDGTVSRERLSYVANTYHGRRVMKVTDNLLFPNIYNNTFFKDLLLSPFHRANQRFYKYVIMDLADGISEVVFIPRARNTQFLSGRAFVNSRTGQVLNMDVSGEYDMVSFHSHIEMNDSATFGLVPQSIATRVTFSFLGNKIESNISGKINEEWKGCAEGNVDELAPTDSIPETIPDSFPESIPETIPASKRPFYKKLDFLILNLSSQFGKNDNMSFRMSPIINPLYISYNHKRGITYRTKMQLDWAISDSLKLQLRPNIGYAFKQKSFHYTIPLKLQIGGGHNIFVQTEAGRKVSYYEDIEYKDFYIDAKFNYDFSSKFGLQTGLMAHKRIEQSFAPYLHFIFRPQGTKGLYMTLDYERSFPNVFGANARYEKYEASTAVSRALNLVSKITAKLSGGFYTSRSKGTYTLDYKNFSYNYLPNGWEDWAGNFQLLSNRLYNQSEWYAAGNLCYETPMLAFSFLPVVGRYTEEERLYCNVLFAEKMHPYIEYGYAFANRLFSVGVFLATKNLKYDGIGVNFSFELFNKW